MAISEEERKRRKNEARNLRRANDPEIARRENEKSAAYRLAFPEKVKAVKAMHYIKNKDLVDAKRRAQYANNPAPFKAYAVEYSKTHKEEISAYSKAYREENSEKIRARRAAAYLKNKDVVQVRNAVWRAKNSDAANERSKEWAKKNPEKRRIQAINRRAWKRDNGGNLSKGVAEKLMILQKRRCACCRIDLKESGYHLDHIESLSMGGANEDSNIQLLCPPCNMSKHTKHSIDFMQSRGFLL